MKAIKNWLRARWGWAAAIAAGVLGFIGISAIVAAFRGRGKPLPPGMTKAEGEAAHTSIDEALMEGKRLDDAYFDSLIDRVNGARAARHDDDR